MGSERIEGYPGNNPKFVEAQLESTEPIPAHIYEAKPENKPTLREVFEQYKVLPRIAEAGENFWRELGTFEDRIRPTQTIPVFSYGSNAPEELQKVFKENGINQEFGFGGEVNLREAKLKFGSRSTARECPVATLREGSADDAVPGYLTFVTKEQFDVIAQKETGPRKGRDWSPGVQNPNRTKGRYRRGLIYFADPRTGEEMQAVTFVLNSHHPDLAGNPIGTEAEIRQRLGRSTEAQKFDTYTGLINRQRREARLYQESKIAEQTPITAYWHSQSFRNEQ